jgi:predicted rRNA methylase YqxC with S4 and FtsJ domains
MQQEAVEKVARAAKSLGLQASPGFPSTLKGPKGNQEYFLYLIYPGESQMNIDKGKNRL